MQSEYVQRTEIPEHVKLERNRTGSEEEHLSQPSTMQSLSHLEEHSSPIHQTPKSSKPQELGHQIKQEVKTQAQNIKMMLAHVFGEKVDTSKDNDESTKQKVRQVNQEIRQLPKRDEQVVESEGKGSGKEESKSLPSQISGLLDKISQHIPQYKDLDHKIRGQINRLNTDIKQLPRKGEQVFETQGQAQEEKNLSQSQQTSSQSNQRSSRAPEGTDLWDIAFHKIDEMKEKAHQKSQEFKQEAEKLQEKIYHDYTLGTFGPQIFDHGVDDSQEFAEHHEHHHLTTESPSFQPTEHSKLLAETVKEVLKDPSIPLTEKVEEVESHWKEEESHQSENQGQSQSLSQIESQSQTENQSQNQIQPQSQAESQGFEQWKQQREQKETETREQGQPQDKGGKQQSREALEKEAQEIAKKFSEKLEAMKETFNSSPEEQQQQPSESKGELQKEEKQTESIKEREPLLDKLMNRIQAVSDNINHAFEDLKNTIKVEEKPVEQSSEQEGQQSQNQPQAHEPFLDQVMNRIHNVSENITHTIEDLRDTFKVEETPAEPSSENEREPLVDKVITGIRKLSHDLEVVKSKLRHEGEGHQSHESSTVGTSQKPITYHNIETVKSKLTPSKPEGQHKQELQPVQTHEGGHSIKERIMEGIHSISDKLHHSMETVKGRFSSAKKADKKQEDQGEFHQVTTGFSETVDEYIHETRWTEPVKSKNPFEAFEDENDEVEEPEEEEEEETVNQPLSGEEESQVQSKSLPQRIKESFAKGIEGVKSKFVSKGKENEGEQENKGEEKEHPVQQSEESQSSKGRIRQGLEEISHKISQNIESVKDKFRSRKEELHKELGESFKIIVINKVKEEIAQPNENFKVSLSSGNEIVKEQLSKLKKKKSRTPKSASKAYPSENVQTKTGDNSQISFEGFHDIIAGFSKSVATLKRELRGAPIVSINPFEGLGAGKQRPTRQRKVSFQQESQYSKKKLARVSQSASKARNIEQSFEGFHDISSGFSESVAHFQKELRGDPLISANPFNPLITKNVNLTQPLDHSQVVGGHLEELTVGAFIENIEPKGVSSSGQKLHSSAKKAKKAFGTDITNKVAGGSGKKNEIKAVIQKTKEGVHDASSKISGKLHEAKGKIKGVFHVEDKENMTQTA